MRNTATGRMWFGFELIAAINRQCGGMSWWNCLKGMWMMLSARGGPDEYLIFRNSLHKNVQFTLEKDKIEGDLAFLDININVSSESNITCHWYQKSTDTGIIVNFRSCAPLQHKKNVVQGTVHRVFNANSNWLAFDQALEKNKNCWTKN